MKYQAKLALALLFSIGCSNLMTQERPNQKDSGSIESDYETQSNGGLSDLYNSDSGSNESDCSSESSESSEDEFDDNLDDPIQREAYIAKTIRFHKYYLQAAEYEILAELMNGIHKEDIAQLIVKAVIKKPANKVVFLEKLYYRIFKYQRMHNMNLHMRKALLPQLLHLPYMAYLNIKYKTKFSMSFLAKALKDSNSITQENLELVFLKTSHKLCNLEPNETLEQIFTDNLHSYVNQQNSVPVDQEIPKTTQGEKSSIPNLDLPDHYITARQGNVIQLDVYQQEDASCGYHALRNGALITQMLRGRITKSRALGMLSDGYNNTVSAKMRTKTKRLQVKFIALVNQILISKLINRDTDAGRMFFNVLPNIAPSLMRIFEIKSDCNIITPDMIKSVIQEEIARQMSLYPNNELLPQLAQLEVIDRHFPQLQEIHILIKDDRLLDHLSHMSIQFESEDISLSDFKNGNWINQEEIRYILQYHYKDVNFIVIGDVGQSTSLETQLAIETEQREMLLDPNTPIKTVIFFMNNHWITCVIHNNGNHYDYYLANSLNNINIVNHPLIRELQNVLDKPSDKPQNQPQDQKPDLPDPIAHEKSKLQFAKSPVNFSDYYTPIPPRAIEIVRSWQENGSSNNLPYSMLLYGEPGTGKSLLAQAIAGEIEAYFYQIVASNTLKKYYGESEEFINNLFRDALIVAKDTKRPIVIFFDEINAVTADSKESARTDILHTIHQLLDSPIYKNKILFICATNSMSLAESFKSRNAGCMIEMPKLNLAAKIELVTNFAREYKVPLSEKQIQNLAHRMHNLSQRETKAIFVLADQKRALAKTDLMTLVFLEEALAYYKKEKADTGAFEQKSETKEDWKSFEKSAKQSFANAAGSAAFSALMSVSAEGAKLGFKAFASRFWK